MGTAHLCNGPLVAALLAAACATTPSNNLAVMATQPPASTPPNANAPSTRPARDVNPGQSVADTLKAYASQTTGVERELHGIVVANNFAEPKPCQLIPLRQAPATDCPQLTPVFWIADRIDAPESERIPVLGLASSVAVIFAALEGGATHGPVVVDPSLGVKVTTPLPCVGSEVTVRGDHNTNDPLFRTSDARAPTGVLRASELRVEGGCDTATLKRWKALSQATEEVGPPTLGRLLGEASAAARETFADATCSAGEPMTGNFVEGTPGVAALVRCTSLDGGEPSARHWLAVLAGGAGQLESVDDWGVSPEGSSHNHLRGILESKNAGSLVLEQSDCSDAGCSSRLSVWTPSLNGTGPAVKGPHTAVLQVHAQALEVKGLEFTAYSDWKFTGNGASVKAYVACPNRCVLAGDYELTQKGSQYKLAPKRGTATTCAQCR
jgi:hypothetical protein